MVLGVTNRIVGGCGGEEVSGDELCTLMDELVERVLAVGTCRTPDDGLEDNIYQRCARSGCCER